MDQFIRRANIEHYRRLLDRITDDVERQRISKLLELEEAKSPRNLPPKDSVA